MTSKAVRIVACDVSQPERLPVVLTDFLDQVRGIPGTVHRYTGPLDGNPVYVFVPAGRDDDLYQALLDWSGQVSAAGMALPLQHRFVHELLASEG